MVITSSAKADVQVIDDQGQHVRLSASARRIISLAPHVTELLFAIGAGSQIIAVDRNSDAPTAAKKLMHVGDTFGLDMERILLLKPDLVIAWPGQAVQRQLSVIQALTIHRIPVFYSNPQRLFEIATTLRRLGDLTGHVLEAENAEKIFNQQLQKLSQQYAILDKPIWRTLLQMGPANSNSVMTLNGTTLQNELIEHCGGRNIFANLPIAAATVNLEAIIREDPQVILYSDTMDPSFFWQSFQTVEAVQKKRIKRVNPDTLLRPGPRILEALGQICKIFRQN